MTKYAYLKESYKQAITERLASLGKHAARQLENEHEGESAAQALRDYLDDKPCDYDAIFDAFSGLTHPQGAKNWKYLHWICASYLTSEHNGQAIWPEDFYKITDNLHDFEVWSTRLYNDSKPNQIDDPYFERGFEALQDILYPYQAQRAEKRAAVEKRRMTTEQRAAIDAETTIIYDGPEGRVVMPHTWESSKYWGDGTKWCISMRESSQYFDDYHKNHPFVFYLPKPQFTDFELCQNQNYRSFKFAAVDGKLWDEKDNENPMSLPPCLQALAVAARTAFTKDYAALSYLDEYGLAKDITDHESKIAEEAAKTPYPEEWKRYLEEIEQDEDGCSDAPERLWRDRDFVLAAIEANSYSFIDGLAHSIPDSEFLNDKDIAMAAVSANGSCFQYLSEELRADKDVAMAAMKQFGAVLSYASDDLKNDKDVVMAAYKSYGGWVCSIAKEITSDPDVVYAASFSSDSALASATDKDKADREFILRIIRNRGKNIEWAPEDMQNDFEMFLEAAQQNPDILSSKKYKRSQHALSLIHI